MVGSSILPVTIHKNKLFFLFGKENEYADTPGWADFGGGVEEGEDIYETAMREGGEELTGFLGNANDVKRLIQKNGGHYKLVHNTYHMHLFYIEYDENLPKYYNNNHKFIWERMDTKKLEKTRIFEKCEIDWFSLEDMKKNRNKFRNFYREIIDLLLSETKNIKAFVEKRHKKHKNKTVKNR